MLCMMLLNRKHLSCKPDEGVMSLTYAQIEHLYHEIKPLVEGSICIAVTVAGPAAFTLHLKHGNEIRYLLLCFKEPCVRFHLIPKPTTVKTVAIPFVQKLAEHLEGETLFDWSLLNEDRILAFTFKKNGKVYRVVAELFPRRPNCYLMDTLQRISAALHPIDHLIYDLPMRPQPRHGDGQAHVEASVNLLDSYVVAALYAEIERQEEYTRRRRETALALKKQCSRVKRRVEQRKEMLHESLQWPEVQHEGMLLQANLFRMKRGDKEVVVADWNQDGKERTILLDPLEEPHEQVEVLFRRSRKLKAGKPHAEKQLKLAEVDLAFWERQQGDFEKVSTLRGLEDFCRRSGLERQQLEKVAAPVKAAPKPYHCFKANSGDEIWVGKSAKDNDLLSFHCANGLDWWLHARDCPGSHVVVRLQKGEELNEETLHDAAELALRHSKDKGQGAGDVTLTQVKYLVPVKGTPGKVMLSKHKTLRVKLDEKRWNRLKTTKAGF